MQRFAKSLIAVAAGLVTCAASAANVAVVEGDFYTSNLADGLKARGHTVTPVVDYSTASLGGFDAVVHYGNSFTDTAALEGYVARGGTLLLTPWSGLNFEVPASLRVFTSGGSPVFGDAYPGIQVLRPGHALLSGVSFPAGGGSFDVGYIAGVRFQAGATPIAAWQNGDAFLGSRSFGGGTVVGLNLQVITSDTAYGVADAPWVARLVSNAVTPSNGTLTGLDATVTPVPEPSTYALMLAGLGVVAWGATRRRRATPEGAAPAPASAVAT